MIINSLTLVSRASAAACCSGSELSHSSDMWRRVVANT